MSLRTLASLYANEVLLTALSSTTQRGAVYVLDPAASSQTPLLHLKGPAQAAPRCVSCVASATHARHASGTSGLVAVMEADKAVLHLYAWQRDQPLVRIILPQKMSAVALSPRGTWIATGAPDGRLYVWEIATGALLCSMEAHYRAITALHWTSDSAALVTASDDARVCVWSLMSLLHYTDLTGAAASGAAPAPYATFTDHMLTVTDLYVPLGAFPHAAHVWSASQDGTVKLWNLANRTLQSTFALEAPVLHLAVDPLERFFVAGTATSTVRIDLLDLEHDRARGGRGAAGVTERVPDAPQRTWNEGVTALALSATASHIAVGTTRGVVHLLDVTTLQTMRTLAAQGTTASSTATTPVTSITSMLRPPDLATALTMRGGAKRSAARDADASASTYVEPLPLPVVAPQFSRTVAGLDDVPHVMHRMGGAPPRERDALMALLAPPRARAAPSAAPSAPSAPATSADTAALQAEIQALQADVQRAKALNDQLWQHLVATQVGATSST